MNRPTRFILVVGALAFARGVASANTATSERMDFDFEAAAVVPLRSEPPTRLIVDEPLAESLARGLVVLRYRTENLKIMPVFGPAALNVSPRLGHLHITVDEAPWHWVDASGEPLIVQWFPPGPHKILVELADPTHKVIDSKTVSFEIPKPKAK